MEILGLEITRSYKELYSFDSSRVKCLGLIKDLCFSLAQIPTKHLIMDIVVVDIPPKYRMILSRTWGAKLQGNIQLDMSYATIPVFNQTIILYQESHMKYMISNQERLDNIPLYSLHSYLKSFILHTNEDIEEQPEGFETNLDPPHQQIGRAHV